MPRLMVVRPAADAALPSEAPAPAPAPVPAPAAREAAYATVMSARCALARFIAAAGHREPPRHRAA